MVVITMIITTQLHKKKHPSMLSNVLALLTCLQNHNHSLVTFGLKKIYFCQVLTHFHRQITHSFFYKVFIELFKYCVKSINLYIYTCVFIVWFCCSINKKLPPGKILFRYCVNKILIINNAFESPIAILY